MSVAVRPVNLQRDQEELRTILNRNLGFIEHSRRFDWLYQNNPAGTGWGWFVYDKEIGKIVGTASVFPRAIWVGREVMLCGVVGNFAIDTNYRSLGPAIMLQRATFEPVIQGSLAFCYDCPPHDRGMAPFRRLGVEANCQMHRYARLLKTGRLLLKRFGSRVPVASIGAVGDLLLDLLPLRKHIPSDLEIAVHTGSFGEEFSSLDEKVGGGDDVIRSRRRAEDLNWRYKDDPLHEYRVLTARRNNELVAFVIVSMADQDAYIVDLFGVTSADSAFQLLEAVAQNVKNERIQTLQLLIAQESEYSDILKSARFNYRSAASHVVAYARPQTRMRAFLDKHPAWHFNYGDVSGL